MGNEKRTPDQVFEDKQKSMSNEALIGFAEDQITELAKTGGRSHTMCIPPMITDTDMLFSELVRRFKKLNIEKNIFIGEDENENLIAVFAEDDEAAEHKLSKKGIESYMLRYLVKPSKIVY